MVDLLADRRHIGFRRETFPELESEKRERAEGVPKLENVELRPLWANGDPRWKIEPPYEFIAYKLQRGGPCVYCGVHMAPGVVALYSRKIQSVAHVDCHAGFDEVVPPGGVEGWERLASHPSEHEPLASHPSEHERSAEKPDLAKCLEEAPARPIFRFPKVAL